MNDIQYSMYSQGYLFFLRKIAGLHKEVIFFDLHLFHYRDIISFMFLHLKLP